MENQLPPHLTQYLENIGVLDSPSLSEQEELVDPRELWSGPVTLLDENGEPTF
jgi:hypothetical protein